MTTRFVTRLILAATLVCSAGAAWAIQPQKAASGPVSWRKTLSSALSEAKKSKKMVMVFLYADWCTWCKLMDQQVFSAQATAEKLKAVIPVRLNVDGNGREFKSEYGVEQFPAIVFLEADGGKFGQFYGYAPPTVFRDEVDKFVSAYRVGPELKAAYKKNRNDAEVNARLAWFYGIQRDLEKSLAHLSVAERMGYRGPHLARAHNMVGDIYQLSDRLAKAIEHFKRADSLTKDPRDRSYSLISLLSCYKVKGDDAAVIKYARELTKLKGATAEYVEIARKELQSRKISP